MRQIKTLSDNTQQAVGKKAIGLKSKKKKRSFKSRLSRLQFEKEMYS